MLTKAMRSTFSRWYCKIGLSAPLRKVTAITYLDPAGALQTLATKAYVVDKSVLQGQISPAYGTTMPCTYDHPAAVAVDFVAGYATPFTVNSTTNTITAIAHPFSNGEAVRLSNSGGALPAGLMAGIDYFAISVSGNTLQLSETEGGSSVDITGDGTGTHFAGGSDDSEWVAMRQAMLLMIGHWYNQREQTTGFQQHQLPMGVNALLGMNKVWGF